MSDNLNKNSPLNIENDELKTAFSLETATLLEKIKYGDEKAFDAIYLRWYLPIFNFLKLLLRNEHDAEDLTQDIFATLWNKWDIIIPAKKGRPFLFTLARNVAADCHRKKSTAKNYMADAVFGSDEDYSPHDFVVVKEIELITEYAISTMPEQRRQVYLFSYKEGLKPKGWIFRKRVYATTFIRPGCISRIYSPHCS